MVVPKTLQYSFSTVLLKSSMLNSFSYQKASKVACTFSDWLQKTEGKPDNQIYPKETTQVQIKSFPESHRDGILCSPAPKVHPAEPSILPVSKG